MCSMEQIPSHVDADDENGDPTPIGGRMSNWSKASQEVLIRGSVPPEAIGRVG